LKTQIERIRMRIAVFLFALSAALPVLSAAHLAAPSTPPSGGPSAAPLPQASPPPAPADMLARMDALYARRDGAAARAEAKRLADTAVAAAPRDYGTLWRAARAYFALSDDPARGHDERAQLGKTAWELAQRAVTANPNDAAGHYWAALGIGSSAEDMGALRALANGIEGKFTGELRRATELDPRYDHGNVFVAWGAYYMELPWPKRDRKKAEEALRRALAINPASLNARIFLARLYADEDRLPEARALLGEIAAAPVGRYDPPEERHAKAEAAKLDATIKTAK
jgi:tetratricopeptide (TPR) repeat protein